LGTGRIAIPGVMDRPTNRQNDDGTRHACRLQEQTDRHVRRGLILNA